MKRILILLTIVLFVAGAVIADEKVLIDFTKLKADIKVNEQDEDAPPNQNRNTMMDYGQVAGGSFTEEQKQVMKTSLAIRNWSVKLTSSSARHDNIALSYTEEAPSKQYETVMGVRVHFPVENWNGSALIRPPFEIPAFEPQAEIGDDGTIQPAEGSNGITTASRFEDAYGVVKNVGTIKSIAVNVYGLNFPHRLWVEFIDGQGNEREVSMGYLNFDGWGELIWNNPQYVQEVRNRELRLYPIYPDSQPFIKFNGFRIERDAAAGGGDFIGYFKDVKVIYDQAVLETERDIEDESLWNIIRDREEAKKTQEMRNFGKEQLLRYLDVQRQAKETTFTPSSGEQAASE